MDAKGEVDDDASASGAFVDAFGASASTPPGSDLHALLVAAIQQLRDAEQIQGFLARVEQRLGVSQRDRVKWQWLLSELRSIEEMDPLRFDSYVSAAITRLERRMDDLAEDPEPVTRGDQATSTGDAGDAATATSWEALSRVLRDGRSTVLRRLVSAGSIGSAADRDSVGSTGETESQMGHRRQAANSIGIPLLQRTSSTASDAMPRLLRSISSMIGISMEETFLCQICFENVAVADAVQLSACGHRFCYPCIKTYLEIKIADGQVYPVCFHEADELSTIGDDVDALRPNERRKACGTAITQSDIEQLVFPDVWKKYVMFRFNKENEYGRQCPFCGESQLCTGPEHPECECVACGKQFCFVHGNAHTDGSCADYELRQAEAEKLNRSAIAEISKPCPGCKANVEKSGGCNHMKCVVCNTDFCWICGAIVESHATPTHFQWWNLRGCAGQQMDDVDAQTPTERFWMSVFRVIFFIVLGPPALIITIALTLTSCCCLPCVFGLEMSFRDLFSMCLNFVAMGLFMILVGLGIAIAFICWLLFEIVALPIRVIYTKCRSCCWRAMPIQRTAGQQSNKSRDLKIDVETSVAVDTA